MQKSAGAETKRSQSAQNDDGLAHHYSNLLAIGDIDSDNSVARRPTHNTVKINSLQFQ